MDVFIGTVMAVGFNFAPRGWMFCNGQILSIAQNSALFALLGTTYGGDGMSTFGLPDLRGRVAVGGQPGGPGPGLTNIVMGEKAGTNNVTVIATGNVSISLTIANLPAHSHPATVDISGLGATTHVTVGAGTTGVLAAASNNGGLTATSGGQSGAAIYLPAGTAPTSPVDLGGVTTAITGSASAATQNTGSGTPLVAPVSTSALTSIMQPYIGLNYIIATEGIFPSRN
ncbi:phage tail protein [Undibacterium danionis]|uniref:Phage tail protein n=1 Tax=Undibacterium danionis TaxID=1812100 RepID=A0ABV6IDX1_9BURK